MTRGNYFLISLCTFLLLNLSSRGQDLATIAEQKPVKVSGSVNAKLQFYDSDKPVQNRQPFVWYLQGSPVVTVYGIVLPFSFRISEQQRDFRQPFNQFGVSPYYKWVKLHLGYRSLNWSTYALAGHSISGAGLELTPGKFHIGFMTGRLLKPVKYIDDPLHTQTQTPAYKRWGTAITLGYGTETNLVSLTFLKARDDSASAGEIPAQYQVTPDENVVVSLMTKQLIAKKFVFELEAARSIYTKDMSTPASDSALGTLDKIFSPFIRYRSSTKASNALKATVGYQSDPFKIMLNYQRVEPDFRSMGAYYFLTDVSNITIEPMLKVMKNKLTLSGSFGLQVDNLDKDKNLRTRRTVSSGRISFVPVPQYNLNAFYSNYGIAQESGLLSIDTLRQSEVAQATQQLGVNQTLSIMGTNLSHNIMLNFNSQKLNDRNPFTSQSSDFTTNILSAGYFIGYMPWSLNGSVSFIYTNFKQDTLVTEVIGPSASLGKSFLKNKLNATVSYAYTVNSVQHVRGNDISTLTVQIGYMPAKNHRFSLKFYRNMNQGRTTGYNSYYENKLDIDYSYSF